MRTRLEHLENNEAVLLMYLFDELLPEDRAEVEKLLETDRGMREHYEQLLATHQNIRTTIQQADQESPLPVARLAADRQIMRVMSQWNTRRLAGDLNGTNGKRGWPIWLYPIATAAAVLLGSMVWWGFHDGGGPQMLEAPNTPIATGTQAPDAPDQPAVQPQQQSPMDVQIALFRSFENVDDMRDVEQEFQALAERRDEGTPVLSLDPMSR